MELSIQIKNTEQSFIYHRRNWQKKVYVTRQTISNWKTKRVILIFIACYF